MTENKKKSNNVEKESVQVTSPFQPTGVKTEEKRTTVAKAAKPLFQTYIYRSYGGGYQGL